MIWPLVDPAKIRRWDEHTISTVRPTTRGGSRNSMQNNARHAHHDRITDQQCVRSAQLSHYEAVNKSLLSLIKTPLQGTPVDLLGSRVLRDRKS